MRSTLTRLLIGTLPGERRPDHALARRQLVGANKPSSKAQHAAEIASFKRNIAKLSGRQLRELHSRLSARLGKAKLAQVMRRPRP